MLKRVIFRIRSIETDRKDFIRVFVSHPTATTTGKLDFPYSEGLFKAIGRKWAYDISKEDNQQTNI